MNFMKMIGEKELRSETNFTKMNASSIHKSIIRSLKDREETRV